MDDLGFPFGVGFLYGESYRIASDAGARQSSRAGCGMRDETGVWIENWEVVVDKNAGRMIAVMWHSRWCC